MGNMRHLFFAAAAAVGLAGSAQAQTAAPAPSGCELHVWPSRNYGANVQGMVSILVPLVGMPLDTALHKGEQKDLTAQLAKDLSPEAQVRMLREGNIAGVLKLPADTRVVFEDTLPALSEIAEDSASADPAQQARMKAVGETVNSDGRLSSSASPCHGELMVSAIAFARDPLDPPVVAVRWIYRRWKAGEAHARDAVGWRRTKVAGYPAKTADQNGAAAAQAAFVRNLGEWAGKKVKG